MVGIYRVGTEMSARDGCSGSRVLNVRVRCRRCSLNRTNRLIDRLEDLGVAEQIHDPALLEILPDRPVAR